MGFMVMTAFSYMICGYNLNNFSFLADECQNKYGNANAWRYCCQLFDLLTVAAVLSS